MAAWPAQRSHRHDEYGGSHLVLGDGCAGLGGPQNAALQYVLVVHARHYLVWRDLSFRKTLFRVAAKVFALRRFLETRSSRKIRTVSGQSSPRRERPRTPNRDYRTFGESRSAHRFER